jgi:hypothetical protein
MMLIRVWLSRHYVKPPETPKPKKPPKRVNPYRRAPAPVKQEEEPKLPKRKVFTQNAVGASLPLATINQEQQPQPTTTTQRQHVPVWRRRSWQKRRPASFREVHTGRQTRLAFLHPVTTALLPHVLSSIIQEKIC